MYVAGPVILILLLCCCICCCKCCRKKSSAVEIVDDSVPMDETDMKGYVSKNQNAGQDTSIQLEDMEDENIAIGHQNSKGKGEVQTDDNQTHDDGKKRYSRVKGDDYTTNGAGQKYPKGYENPFNGKVTRTNKK